MSAITSDPPITPDDLMKMPDAVAYELVDGQLVERNVGAESSAVAAKIIVLLGLFLRDRPLGKLFGSDARTRTVRIYRPKTATAGTTSMLSADDQISGEDVLPGFTVAVREFFED